MTEILPNDAALKSTGIPYTAGPNTVTYFGLLCYS